MRGYRGVIARRVRRIVFVIEGGESPSRWRGEVGVGEEEYGGERGGGGFGEGGGARGDYLVL